MANAQFLARASGLVDMRILLLIVSMAALTLPSGDWLRLRVSIPVHLTVARGRAAAQRASAPKRIL
jgi:hypothetical protein